MADVNVSVDDGGERDRYARLAVFLTDLRSFWPLLVPVATSWWRRQFETEGEFGGARWAALSPQYERWKSIHFPGKPILQRTGDMKRAASSPIRAQTPTTLTLTIDDPKLAYHQQDDEHDYRLPRRPLVFGDPLPPQAQHELDEIAERYIEDLLRRV